MTAPGYRIAVIGAGKLGTVLAKALVEAGATVRGPYRRDQPVDEADVMLLCVPDREIANAARQLPAGPIVGHCSGIAGAELVHPHPGFVMHPLMTVAEGGGGSAPFEGAAAAIAATSPAALDAAAAIARTVGMEPITVPEGARASYHAAASMASNFLVVLESAAESLALRGKTGIERRHLAVLAQAALDNWARLGTNALTGPIQRGDRETVARQREAVGRDAPELLALWDALVSATESLARGELRAGTR